MSQPQTAAALTPRGRLAQVAEDGFLSGVIGGTTVALLFLIVDLLQGQPFFTPSLLGQIFLQGADPATVTSVSPPMVVAYTAVHMALFVAAGMAAAYAVSEFETRPHVGVVLLLLFLCFEAAFLGFAIAFAPGLIGTLGGLEVAIANLLSAGAMAGYLLWWRHPGALRNLDKVWED